jgi:deoxyuridine 5'-triphosphate nucleotidohydrolase
MTHGDRLFGDMSRPEHAYALGVVAVAGRVREGSLEIRLRGDGEPLLGMLRARGAGDIPALHEVEKGRVRVFAPLGTIAAGHLGAVPGDKVKMRFPVLRPELMRAFVRGIFDVSARISPPSGDTLTVRLDHPGEPLLEGLLGFLSVKPDRVGKQSLRWEGVTALDLLGRIYDDCVQEDLRAEPTRSTSSPVHAKPNGSSHAPHTFRFKHLARYLRWTHRIPQFRAGEGAPANIRWTPVHPDARAPFKERVTDSGYDLTLLYEKKRVGSCILYGTGVVIEPPFGWYLDVVPRSSIIKTGYLLANNVGVIDRGYRGEVLVPLIKIDPNAPDLPLPARVVQMVPRPIAHFGLQQTDGATSTHRGAGGFGSTG